MSIARKHVYRPHHRPGTAPGTLRHIKDAPPPHITIIAYDQDHIEESTITRAEDIIPYLEKWPVSWINIDGLGSVETIEKIGDILELHTLALEDVLNIHHRAKTEDFGDHLFVLLRQARLLADNMLDMEQISMFVGSNYILTFQERAGDCLEPVRERLRKGGRRIRMSKTDYMAYAIMDAVIDGYFPVLEYYGDTLNDLEDQVVENPDRALLATTHNIKRDLRLLRQAAWPMREMINGFAMENKLVQDSTGPFIRDCYDHVIQLFDILETYRERTSGLTDLYLSSLSHRMNEVMKVLTIIATIFIPLTFVAGIYGMNFDPDASPWNMPELDWYYGYPLTLGVMAAIAFALLAFFRRKGWF